MSTNSTTSGTPTALDPTRVVHPSLITLMITHSFTVLLIPLFIALFYFSTPQSRRRSMFVLNAVSIIIGFANGVVNDVYLIHTVLEPAKVWGAAFNVAFLCIGVGQSIVVDFTLFLRLVTVYPPNQLGDIPFALLIAIPVLLKVTRVVNLIIFAKAMIGVLHKPNSMQMLFILYTTTPYINVEWTAQVIDNAYASAAFLWKMRRYSADRVQTNSSKVTLGQRMHALFRIAATNFVIPTILSIAQLICHYRNIDGIILDDIVIANTMAATFGVVFATVWAGSVNQQEEKVLNSKFNQTASRLKAMFGHGAGRAKEPLTLTGAGSGYSSRDEFKP